MTLKSSLRRTRTKIMVLWTPTTIPEWKNKDVFILGGGRSMLNFDWSILHDKLVLGCNFAFRLGSKVVDANLMCDKHVIKECYEELQTYHGVVYLNPPNADKQPSIFNPSWAYTVPRVSSGGLSLTGLVWGGNTGNSAVNLALLLGASRVYLLGFDMKAKDPKNPDWYQDNYHDHKERPATSERFKHWITNFGLVQEKCKSMFPNTKIVNINSDSDLNIFEKIPIEQFFGDACFLSPSQSGA